MSTPVQPQTTELSFKTSDGLLLAAKEWGQKGGFPILALHGWLDNANTWDNLFPHLISNHPKPLHIVALDFAGHGKSEHRHPQADYLFYKYVEEVIQVADFLGWSRFALIGHSMGGGVASLVASVLPNRVTHLINIESFGPATRPVSTAIQFLSAYLNAKPALIHSRKRIYTTLEEATNARATGNPNMPLSLSAAKILVERGTNEVETEDGVHGYEWSTDQKLRLPWPVHWSEEIIVGFLQNVRCPMLCVMGDEGMKIFNVEERVKVVKDLEVVTVKGGHHVHLDEAGEECAGIVDKWLTKHAGVGRAMGPVPRAPVKRYKL